MRYALAPWVWRLSPYPHWEPPAGAVGSIDLRSAAACGSAGGTPGFGLACFDSGLIGSDCVDLGTDLEGVLSGVQKAAWKSVLGLTSLASLDLRGALAETLTLYCDPANVERFGPLVPNHKRQMEIYLAGRCIYSKPFNIGQDEASAIIELHRREYRELAALAEAGKLKDSVHHLRVLDDLGKKYGVSRPQDVFVPDDMPKLDPVLRETTITESFNKADSDTLGPDLTWTEVAGDIDVFSNRARASTSGAIFSARAESDLSSADHYSQVSVVTLNTGGHIGPCARFATAANTYYRVVPYDGDSKMYLSKIVAGVETHIGTAAAITISLPQLYKAEISGSTLKGYQAGVERRSETDTSISGGTRCGIGGYTGADISSVDSFEASDLGGGGGGTSAAVFYFHRTQQGMS